MGNDFKLIEGQQQNFCIDRGIVFVGSPPESTAGVALSTMGLSPINGLRHPLAGDSNGWYIWGGEKFSSVPDFFSPVHVSHLYAEQPEIAAFLGLPPGYRFLLAGTFIDVWFDATLLEI